MKNMVKRALLSVFAIAGGLVVAPAIAAATETFVSTNIWVNYQGEEHGHQFCMGVSGGNMNSGTPVIVWDCDYHNDQNWNAYYENSMDWIHFHDNQSNNMCLAARNNGRTDGTALVIEPCDTANLTENFAWLNAYITDGNGNPCYYLWSIDAEKVAGASGGNVSDGTPVILWDSISPGHDDQIWCKAPVPQIHID